MLGRTSTAKSPATPKPTALSAARAANLNRAAAALMGHRGRKEEPRAQGARGCYSTHGRDRQRADRSTPQHTVDFDLGPLLAALHREALHHLALTGQVP